MENVELTVLVISDLLRHECRSFHPASSSKDFSELQADADIVLNVQQVTHSLNFSDGVRVQIS